MALLEFAMAAGGDGEGVSEYVARILDVIDRSGVPYQLTPMEYESGLPRRPCSASEIQDREERGAVGSQADNLSHHQAISHPGLQGRIGAVGRPHRSLHALIVISARRK